MNETRRNFLLTLITIFVICACSAQPTQAQPSPSQSQQTLDPVLTPDTDLPRTDREVPRLSVEEAKAALDSGAAIIVDVRNPRAFASRHIAGAINIPLGEIEMNLTGLSLDKDQWIITYCT
jgi:3-mercaptopyruvate sulfurtransferase SseA